MDGRSTSVDTLSEERRERYPQEVTAPDAVVPAARFDVQDVLCQGQRNAARPPRAGQ
ncbi:hypothetical protein HNR23_003876 [Nocardiopsis mwathae]|uniref:Uncharacterized protein n=1 Tax=Nocardiopsis mwathae TaxID=1472723 RepID=A0A7W9YM99_9ACTN|nr:hypothetical protein [Nocardiopsis mwathae]MBB6173816.1 hypothetical protein [Nocardiopsis mwathae]